MNVLLRLVGAAVLVGCPQPGPTADSGRADSGSDSELDGGCERVHASVDRVVDLELPSSWVWTEGRGSGIGLVNASQFPTVYRFVSAQGGVARLEPLITSLDTVKMVDSDRTVCGGYISSTGVVRVAIEFGDGGVFRADAGGNCMAYNNGWWATTVELRPARGSRSGFSASVYDGGAPPYLMPYDIDAEGNVLVDVSGDGFPYGKVLPSGQEIRSAAGRAAYVYRFGGPGVVFGVTLDDQGHNRVARWSNGSLRLLPSPVAAGDVVLNAVGSDDRVCATLLGTGEARVVLWNQSGQFVEFSALDAGRGIGTCNQLLDDGWIAVGLSRDAGQLTPGLVRVTWSCGP